MIADAKIIRGVGAAAVTVAVAIAFVGNGTVTLVAVGANVLEVAAIVGAAGDWETWGTSGGGMKVCVATGAFAPGFVTGGCVIGIVQAVSVPSATAQNVHRKTAFT